MTTMLFVGNLGVQTTDDQLVQSFASFGCTGAEIVMTGTTYRSESNFVHVSAPPLSSTFDFSEELRQRRKIRKPRGFGFVYFSDESQMEAAFAAATPPNRLLLRTGDETEPRVLRVAKYAPKSLHTSDGLVELSDVAAESVMEQRCPMTVRTKKPKTPRNRTKKQAAADDDSLSSLSSFGSSTLSAAAAPWTPPTPAADSCTRQCVLNDEDTGTQTGSSTLQNQTAPPQGPVSLPPGTPSATPPVSLPGSPMEEDANAPRLQFIDGGGFACL